MDFLMNVLFLVLFVVGSVIGYVVELWNYLPWWYQWILIVIVLVKVVFPAMDFVGWKVVGAFADRREMIRPRAYYEEHNGVYAVFLPGDMYKTRKSCPENPWLWVVTPTMTFGPDSRRSYPYRFTGIIPDMVRLFEGWDLRYHDMGGSWNFFVPGSSPQKNEAVQLDGNPVVDMAKAREILATERERLEREAPSVAKLFWRSLWHW